MNQTTIQYIQDNYKLILKNLRNLGSLENVEDAISDLYIRLSKQEYNIENPKAFISMSVSRYISKMHRSQRRLVALESTYDPAASCIIELVNDEQEQNNRLRLMKEKIQELPGKQRIAIENYIEYGKTSLVPGNPNTNKMNFHWAMQTLKSRLGFIFE